MIRIGLLLCVMTALGCGNRTKAVYCPTPMLHVTAPGFINHVVLFTLHDPADTESLIADCHALLRLPGVTSGAVGRHFDVGRPSAISDYDVGFFIAFDGTESYLGYIDHPDHVALVEKWKDRWASVRVYDIGDARSIQNSSNQ